VTWKMATRSAKSGRGEVFSTKSGDISRLVLLRGLFPLFSFLERVCRLAQSLAGDELDESRNSNVPSMRTAESVQRRCPIYKLWRDTALPVSILWLSILGKVMALRPHCSQSPFSLKLEFCAC
jgi:hypothetical protein